MAEDETYEAPKEVAMSTPDAEPDQNSSGSEDRAYQDDKEESATDTVLEMTGTERVFLAETVGIRRRLDRIGQLMTATQILVAAGLILFAMYVVKQGKVTNA